MQVKHLVYTGAKTGDVIVRQEHATSPWRKLAVYPGWRKQVGTVLPHRVAKHVLSMLKDSFELVVEELDDLGEIKQKFFDLLQVFEGGLGLDSAAILPPLVTEALIDMYGEEALKTISTALLRSAGLGMTLDGRMAIIKEVFKVSAATLNDLDQSSANQDVDIRDSVSSDFGDESDLKPTLSADDNGGETSGEKAAADDSEGPSEAGDKTIEEEASNKPSTMTGTDSQPAGGDVDEEEEEEELDDEPEQGKTSRRNPAPKKGGSRRKSPVKK